MTITKEQIDAKLAEMTSGGHAILSDALLDAMADMYPDDARLNRLRTVPNPNRVGVLDQYVGTIDPPAPDLRVTETDVHWIDEQTVDWSSLT
jgi:hypothetical protein